VGPSHRIGRAADARSVADAIRIGRLSLRIGHVWLRIGHVSMPNDRRRCESGNRRRPRSRKQRSDRRDAAGHNRQRSCGRCARTSKATRLTNGDIIDRITANAPTICSATRRFGQINNLADNMRVVQFTLRFQF
jgi:hypothetical protein